MQELTSAVSEDEVINFFMHVIAPHVLKHQKAALHVKLATLSSPTDQLPSKGKEEFVNRLKSKLEFVVKEAPKEQVWNTLYMHYSAHDRGNIVPIYTREGSSV